MSLSTEQYVALSALVYSTYPEVNFNSSSHPTIATLINNPESVNFDPIKDYRNGNSNINPEFSHLASLGSYTLISFTSDSSSGFAGAAFQAPPGPNGEPGEIIFSFRGTEPFTVADLMTDTGIFMQDAYAPIVAQMDAAKTFAYSILNNSAYSGASYSFTGHSLGGSLASYMTYVTNTDNIAGVGKSVTFNAPGIGGVIEAKDGVGIDPREYDSLVTDYVNASDVIGNYSASQQLGTTKYIQSRLGSTAGEDAGNMMNFLAALSPLGDLISPLEKLELTQKAASSGANIAQNSLPTANHSMGDMLNAQGNMMPTRDTQTAGASFIGYIAEGTYEAASGAKFAIVTIGDTIGGLIYYGATGVISFVNTSGHIISGLSYYGAEGVEKFIDTSEYILGGIGYYTITGAEDFFQTTGNGIAEGVWDMSMFVRDIFTNSLNGVFGLFSAASVAAPVRVDPIILDLDGDGIETTNLTTSNAHFDLDANGFAEQTGWVSADDGILTLDRDGDGKVDNGQELFGDRTVLRDGSIATSGFQALAEFDENKDGIIDANDSVFTQLKVWQDLNGDGISTANELKTLTQLNIKSISLDSVQTQVTDAMNNIQRRLGSFTLDDGTQHSVGEYLLNRDTRNTREVINENITIPSDVALLPNLQGAGDVASLQVAMTNDATLKTLVQDFVNAPNAAARVLLLPQILYRWTGSDLIDPASRGANIDARQLTTLERFLGTGFIGTNGTSPNTNAAPILQGAYNELSDRIYSSLIARSVYKNLIDKIQYTSTATGITLDFTQVIADLEAQLSTNHSAGLESLSEFSRALKGYNLQSLSGFSDFRNHFLFQSSEYALAIDVVGANAIRGSINDDYLTSTAFTTAIAGGAGNDTISANLQGMMMYGQEGDDALYGNAGQDTLVGGKGNDRLSGGYGNDIYLFELGDGQDVIYDNGGIDTLKFGVGISPENVKLDRVWTGSGYDLVISITGTDDKINVQQYFGYAGYWGYTATPEQQIEKIVFADGTIWTQSTVYDKLHNRQGTSGDDYVAGYDYDEDNTTLYGLAGNDSLSGRSGNDLLDGGSGDDVLSGNAGNDILIGGTGNDTLYGGYGDDTYIFNLGDGQDTIWDNNGADTIQLGSGINPADIKLDRVWDGSGYNLVMSIVGTSDKITIRQFFGTSSYWGYDPLKDQQIEKVIFADGTIWTPEIIYNKMLNRTGTSGDDTISSYDYDEGSVNFHGLDGNDYLTSRSGDDVLDGGAGNDTLVSNNGNDTLIGGTGNDTLYGGYGDDTYIFNLGDGQDTIWEQGGTDTIQFGAGINPSDIRLDREWTGSGYDLILRIVGTDDKINVQRYFGTSSYWGYQSTPENMVERFTFSDGTIWTSDDIYMMVHNRTGTAGDDSLVAYDYDEGDVIYHGLAGNDTLIGHSGNDILDGGAGNDTLLGNSGNDTLRGGAGEDNLQGGYGDDTYIFNLGDGQDVITEVGGADVIQFGAGINPNDVSIDRVYNPNSSSYDLVLSVADTDDKLTIIRHFGYYSYYGIQQDLAYQVEQIVFSDGTIWTPATIDEKIHNLTGTDNDDSLVAFDTGAVTYHGLGGNDTLTGGSGNDTLYGDAGDDRLYGNTGNDVLIGGTGNDDLQGGYGDDTYVFNLGDGQDIITESDGSDTIQLGEGIDPSNVSVARVYDPNTSSYNLVLTIGANDKLTIVRYFGYNYYGVNPSLSSVVEQIAFANGTVWTSDTIDQMMHNISGTSGDDSISAYDSAAVVYHGLDGDDTLYGSTSTDTLYGDAGNDHLYANAGNDTLTGGTGNDDLQGGAGDDTYVFALGDGQDTITESSGVDTLQFGIGIGPNNVSVNRVYDSNTSSYNLVLSIAGTTDQITVYRHFGYNYYGLNPSLDQVLEQITFADGTVWTAATLDEKMHNLTGTAGNDDISAYDAASVTYHGLDGDDTLYGSSSDDNLYGDASNDTLVGNNGNDLLVGGTGNDNLQGGYGDDTYVFARGDGQDTIYENGGMDTIQFSAGIDPDDVVISRVYDSNNSAYNLVLSIVGTDDKITVNRHFGYNYYGLNPSPDQVIEQVTFADGTVWTAASMNDMLHTANGTSGDDVLSAYDSASVTYHGNDGNDTLYGSLSDDHLYGDAGDDYLYGNAGNDVVQGGSGNDYIDSGAGDDTVYGGAGNDTLYDGGGNDNYVFNLGDGQDTINDSDGSDTITFGEGITPADITITRTSGSYSDQNNLIIGVKGSTDLITVKGYFYGGLDSTTYKIEQFVFADGTVWTNDNIKEALRTYTGTSGNDSNQNFGDQDLTAYGFDGDDTLYGSSFVDKLYGGNGNDYLYANSGNDILDGGAGDDHLYGDSGNDTYVFGRGYGSDTIQDYGHGNGDNDVIQFLEGISPSDIAIKRVYDNVFGGNNALEISIIGTTDKLTIQGYFYYGLNSPNYKVDILHFADGTVWTGDTIKEKLRTYIGTEGNDSNTNYGDQDLTAYGLGGDDTLYGSGFVDKLYGGDGNDVLYASSGNDTLDGGAGDDRLYGDSGNDIYVFGRGYGSDTIQDYSGGNGDNDIVTFLEGVSPSDIIVKRVYDSTFGGYNALELSIDGTNDKLTVQGYFYYGLNSPNYKVGQFQFNDSTIWTIDTIKEKLRTYTGTSGNDANQNFGDQDLTAYGLDGDDTLYGSGFVDKLYGGNGNDSLYASSGNDILDGGAGDDRLYGDSGNDTYIFGRGYGSDIIQDYSGGNGDHDVVQFLEGVSPSDVTVKRVYDNSFGGYNALELSISGTSDKLTLQGYFYYGIDSPNYKVSEFHFADGTIWTNDNIKEKLRTYTGTSGNDTNQNFGDQDLTAYGLDGDDTLYGSGFVDKLYGGNGNDTLYASSGNDILDGGAGDDRLYGDSGNDTYIFGRGYGSDTIQDYSGGNGDRDIVQLLEGITPDDVTVKRVYDNSFGGYNALELSINGTSDKLTLQGYFYYGIDSPNYKLAEFHFADGTVWTNDNIKERLRTYTGTAGNDSNQNFGDQDLTAYGLDGDDTLYGSGFVDKLYGGNGNDNLYASSGNDVLNGGSGNDYLYGDAGDDTYEFSGDFGADHISDYSGNDLVTLDRGQDSLIFQQSGNTLQMLVAGSSNSITVDSWYQSNDYKIETFKASDGSTISSTQIEQLIQAMASFSNDNGGMSWSDALQQKPQDVQAVVSQYWTASTV